MKVIIYGALVVSLAGLSSAQVNVLTANYGNERSNSNLQETTLTPANVSASSFGKLGALPLDGQIYAQPLYVSGLMIPGQGTHNVIFAATQHNTVFAYDADQTSPAELLWAVNLGQSVLSSVFGAGYTDVTPEIGILSTPVIDISRGVIYVVSTNPANGTVAYTLHALSLTDGKEMLNGPIAIRASVQGSGAGNNNGTLAFDGMWHIQRPALLLANNAVWIGFGSHADQQPWHGWLLSYNASDLSQAPGAFNATPDGWGGSFWQSGFGLAADSAGGVYAISGNGVYDGVTNFGESFLKFTGSTPALSDSFTPPNWQLMADQDYDLSAGPALIPGTHTLIGGDKYGLLYVVDGDSMGGLDRGNSTAQIVQATTNGGVFNFTVWGQPQFSTIYLQQKAGPLKAFTLDSNGLHATPTSVSNTTSDSGYVGIALTANDAQAGTGIVWETTNTSSLPGNPGTLHAFDASNLSNEIWNSNLAQGGADTLGRFAKFANPTVVNGKAYVPTGSNAIVVYGLKQQSATTAPAPAIAAVTNSASYAQGNVAPGELVTFFGSNLGPKNGAGMAVDANARAASLVANTVVLFDGIPATMVYTSAGQVSAIAPYSLSAATTSAQVVYQGMASTPVQLAVTATAPGIYSLNSSGTGGAVIINQDGTVNSATNPAAAGSYIYFYATGTGVSSPQPLDGSVVGNAPLPQSVATVTAQVGGRNATVLYAGGAPGMVAGVTQVNLQIPAGLSGSAIPLAITANGVTSQAGITIAVK